MCTHTAPYPRSQPTAHAQHGGQSPPPQPWDTLIRREGISRTVAFWAARIFPVSLIRAVTKKWKEAWSSRSLRYSLDVMITSKALAMEEKEKKKCIWSNLMANCSSSHGSYMSISEKGGPAPKKDFSSLAQTTFISLPHHSLSCSLSLQLGCSLRQRLGLCTASAHCLSPQAQATLEGSQPLPQNKWEATLAIISCWTQRSKPVFECCPCTFLLFHFIPVLSLPLFPAERCHQQCHQSSNLGMCGLPGRLPSSPGRLDNYLCPTLDLPATFSKQGLLSPAHPPESSRAPWQ